MTDLHDDQVLGRVVRLLDANKALAAWLTPLALAAATTFASWIATGNFSGTELRFAAGGTVLSIVSGLAAYSKSTNHAVVKPLPLPAEPPTEG